MLKERPILFSSQMVRAILEGRKTQTRRVVKNVTITLNHDGRFNYHTNTKRKSRSGVNIYFEQLNDAIAGITELCPYGQPGDLLWVRETFAKMCSVADPYCQCEDSEHHYFEYKADSEKKFPGNWDDADNQEQKAKYVPSWKPSIHMPKSAARIWLRITDVRVERLQDINTEDIKCEGVLVPVTKEGHILWSLGERYSTYSLAHELSKSTGKTNDDLAMFVHWAELWMNINGMESWKSNPWVWVVEFEVISKTGKPC